MSAVVVIVALGRATPSYPFPGSRTSTRYVIEHLRPDDAVFLTSTSPWPFAIESDLPVEVSPRPHGALGYVPEVRDHRVHNLESTNTNAEFAAALDGVRRVFVHIAEPGVTSGGVSRKAGITFLLNLRFSGFTKTQSKHFGAAIVNVYTR